MAGGALLQMLESARERYPLSFHSVGMSPGSADGVDTRHVERIKQLARRFQPGLISDHLSWSRLDGAVLNDLLPMPYTREALDTVVDNVDQIQNILGRAIAIENPSAYFAAAAADMDECDFLLELARRSGAGILLDVNNVYVSACNQGWRAQDYLRRIPPESVVEIHLAGHKVEDTEAGEVRVDDHGSPVCEAVWRLYEFALDHIGPRPTLIEWDANIPALEVLIGEARRAEQSLAPRRMPARLAG